MKAVATESSRSRLDTLANRALWVVVGKGRPNIEHGRLTVARVLAPSPAAHPLVARCTLTASPAVGFVGQAEGSYLNEYFGCMGFMPIMSQRYGPEAWPDCP